MIGLIAVISLCEFRDMEGEEERSIGSTLISSGSQDGRGFSGRGVEPREPPNQIPVNLRSTCFRSYRRAKSASGARRVSSKLVSSGDSALRTRKIASKGRPANDSWT